MAFFKKGKAGKSPGMRFYTHEEIKMVGWCMNKNIFVSISPGKGLDDWFLEIKLNGKAHTDSKAYTGLEALDKLYEYYKYYYDKHNKLKQ